MLRVKLYVVMTEGLIEFGCLNINPRYDFEEYEFENLSSMMEYIDENIIEYIGEAQGLPGYEDDFEDSTVGFDIYDDNVVWYEGSAWTLNQYMEDDGKAMLKEYYAFSKDFRRAMEDVEE